MAFESQFPSRELDRSAQTPGEGERRRNGGGPEEGSVGASSLPPDPGRSDACGRPRIVGRARARLAGEANTLLVHCDFEQFVPDEDGYDLITFVASLHHMDPRAALTRAARLLRPGGELLVVGLTANRSPLDWAFSALTLPVARFGSLVHHETRDIGVPVAGAREDLREICRIAREVLPGARIRRGLYYRYLLRWTGPAG